MDADDLNNFNGEVHTVMQELGPDNDAPRATVIAALRPLKSANLGIELSGLLQYLAECDRELYHSLLEAAASEADDHNSEEEIDPDGDVEDDDDDFY